ncbi:PREDICTED: coiled-coil domain-containing protein 186-like isoform X2 [Branchiostoma belcheri]|uniref:Coiled-coil domain-containing protein 186-like isoform X2 n=1 Tax=Branchiostoma belcheri TaxID=7741 RepID=A0A6P4YPK1_BRABE|nr:PREDICTED: coiled-coil domain-containing protein 186-like isoform X2 [Branchiostoma belcheri]
MEADDPEGAKVTGGGEGMDVTAEVKDSTLPEQEQHDDTEKDAAGPGDREEEAATESSDETSQENSQPAIEEAETTEDAGRNLEESPNGDSVKENENSEGSTTAQRQDGDSLEDSEGGEDTIQSESSETESKDELQNTEDNMSTNKQADATSEDVTQVPASNRATSEVQDEEEPEAFQSTVTSGTVAATVGVEDTVQGNPTEYSELTEADQDNADGIGASEGFGNVVDVEEALDSPLTSTSLADSDQELDLAESLSNRTEGTVDDRNSLQQDDDLVEGDKMAVKHTEDQRYVGNKSSVPNDEQPMEEISLDDVQEEERKTEEPTQPMSPLEGCERTILRTEVEPEHTGSSVYSVSEGEDALLSELDAALQPATGPMGDPEKRNSEKTAAELPNGLRNDLSLTDAPEYAELKVKFETLMQSHTDQAVQLQSLSEDLQTKTGKLAVLSEEKDVLKAEMKTVVQERDTLKVDLNRLQSCATNEVHATRIRQLEASVLEHQKEAAVLKEKLGSHDAAAKRAITTLQREMGAKLAKAQQLYEDSVREKESMVIKYAKSESQLLDLTKVNETLDRRLKDAMREREGLVARLKQFHAESQKVRQQADTKESEVSARNKEMDKLKEEMNSHIIKVRWSQNKLKTETEAHRETKAELEKMRLKLKEAKEESEQIRRNCQEMIKTYQESEEVKSVSLDKQLKEKETQLMMQQHQRSEEKEVLENLKKELDALKHKYKGQLSENNSLKTKVACYEEERQKTEDMVRQYKDALGQQKSDNIGLQERMRQLEELQKQLDSTKQEKGQFQEQVRELRSTVSDQEASVTTSRAREQELLVFTEKLTAKNTQLTTENNTLQAKVDNLTMELRGLRQTLEELKTEKEKLSKELAEEQDLRSREAELLTQRLSEKSRAVEQLTIQIEDQKDEIKTLKRKHQQGVKDLTRQLQQAKKKLEAIEASQNEGKELSSSSRASSCTSLDKVSANGMPVSGSPPVQNAAAHASSEEDNVPAVSYKGPAATEQEDPYPNIDKSVLVERILKLQKAHARKNEKLEFMDDHITQMVDEVKKKTKIIQMYVMREEAGTLSTEFMDDNKARMARKGGIMASLYSGSPHDSEMTFDLSLEINRKLQAVLEDTLLKNITLKENLETLGDEIARLTRELAALK